MKKLLLSMAMVAVGSAAMAQISSGSMMFGGTIGIRSQGGTNEISGSPVPAQNRSIDLPSQSNFNLGLTGGYFIQDNLAVGATIGFGSTSNVTKSAYNKTTGAVTTPPPSTLGADDVLFDDETATSGFNLNLFANKYNEINDKWMWFYGAGLGFGTGSGTSTAIEEITPGATPPAYAPVTKDAPSTTTISLGANLGVIHFLSENWALQAGLNNLLGFTYTMGSSEVKAGPVTSKTSTSDMNLNLGTGSFGLGGLNVGVFYFLR
jgi:hypothetical protein